MKKFSEDIQKRIRDHRFPPEAIKDIPGKGGKLKTISAAYIVEFLNDVFGIGGWNLSASIDRELSTDTEIIASGYLQAGEVVTPLVYGGKKNNNNGETSDLCKGAFTAVLSKASSYWGIGLYVYKGELDRGVKKMTGLTPELLEKWKWDHIIHADGCIYLEGSSGRAAVSIDSESMRVCRSLIKQ